MRFLPIVCLMFLLLVNTSSAEDNKEGAEFDFSKGIIVTSAWLAEQGETLVDTSALSLPDGRQVLVTYWRDKAFGYFRCFDTYSAKLKLISESCRKFGD